MRPAVKLMRHELRCVHLRVVYSETKRVAIKSEMTILKMKIMHTLNECYK